MNYRFSEEEFKESFKWKSLDERYADSLRIKHIPDNRFKLFPYKASSNKISPTITDMGTVIGDFIKLAIKVESPDTDFQNLIDKISNEINATEDDFNTLKKVIRSRFYKDDEFDADNIGMYAYKGKAKNTSIDRMAYFLNDIFSMDENDADAIRKAMSKYHYNVLERLITDFFDKVPLEQSGEEKHYYIEFCDAAIKFKNDLHYMLEIGMTAPQDLANLLSLYYLYYTAQTCIVLDHFGEGNRNDPQRLFFALDWEKVSINRECCKGGWKKLHENVSHIFAHAITLEILNQTEDTEEMYDYISLVEAVRSGLLDDHATAEEVRKAESIYVDAVGDYNFDSVPTRTGVNETDSAIRHLFECVKAQFKNTTRNRANEAYIEKLLDFYKVRWLKNRRKAGLVLNLTEGDIIFLTKISIQNRERIRLIDLFVEFEKRGVYLDNISKSLLQEFYTKLNLLDKKSDSGDSQYVKRIL